MKTKVAIMLLFVIAMSCGKQKHVGRESQSKGQKAEDARPQQSVNAERNAPMMHSKKSMGIKEAGPAEDYNREQYDIIGENKFVSPLNQPLSTFSIDVDRAAYANLRRFLNNSRMPPKDAVRIEEMINYFDYDYPQPKGKHPFHTDLELNTCPWDSKHQLLKIGLQGKRLNTENLPPSNLVFLLDVSGSMKSQNKLPLLKKSFRILLEKMRPEDKISIVVYAGAAGTVLEPTPGDEKEKIKKAMNQLQAGGSTAGGEGIELAYKLATEEFIEDGNNRIILATDGDFNIGMSSDAAMVRLIEKKREQGVYLTVLGFGTGNYQEAKMEKISNAGNGNFAYIDNILEAKKVLGKEIWGTLYAIAKDVKVQIEFNPANVRAYRLIGYANRMLEAEDFNDDKKDAGDVGSGHTVTALYEIIPPGTGEKISDVDTLKYQQKAVVKSDDVLTLKLRYKQPDADKSILMQQPFTLKDAKEGTASRNFRLASAVAEFGLLLRESDYAGNADYNHLQNRLKSIENKDDYIRELIRLAETAALLAKE